MSLSHGGSNTSTNDNNESNDSLHSQKTTLDKLSSVFRASMKHSEEKSVRGLFGRDKEKDDPWKRRSLQLQQGPSMREGGTMYYMDIEVRAAQDAIKKLDEEVSKAQSFREKATKLLEEAHRALSRLEQAIATNRQASELIVVACEIKCAALRGVTLVKVHGGYSALGKVATLMIRSMIYAKFDKQIDHLRTLIPVSELSLRQGPSAAASLAAPASDTPPAPPSSVSTPANTTPGRATTPLAPVVGAACAGMGALARSSLSNQVSIPSPAAAPAGPPQGTMLRPNKHDKVYAMAYVPPGQTRSDHVCIWWSAGLMLEFYSEAAQSTTGFQIEKQSVNVTAIGIDEDGNVWTGHAKGLIRVRQKAAWDYVVEDKCFASSIRAIQFDAHGRAWIGDEAGRIKVLSYDAVNAKMEVVAVLQRSEKLFAKMKALAEGTRGLFGKRHCSSIGATSAAVNIAAAAAAVLTGGSMYSAELQQQASPAASPSTSVAPSVEGPVRCLFLRGGRAWACLGTRIAWLMVWDSNNFQDLDAYDCCAFGPINAMAGIRWTDDEHGDSEPGAAHGAVRRNRSVSSLASRSVTALAAADALYEGPWRLLTGHENGQLLMWNPDQALAPLLRIGDPYSAVRGIVPYSFLNMVVVGHHNGELRIFAQPHSLGVVPPGANSSSPQSFGTLRPRMVILRAHKSSVDKMVGSSATLVTASQLGTIRLWHAMDLAAEAQRLGLQLRLGGPPPAASLSQLALAQQLGLSGAGTAASMPLGGTISSNSLRERATSEQVQAGGAPNPKASISSGDLSGHPGMSGYPSMKRVASLTEQQLLQQAKSPGHLSPSGHATNGPTHTRNPSRDSVVSAVDVTAQGGALAGLAQQGSGSASEGLGYISNAASGIPGLTGVPHVQTIDASELVMSKLIGSGAYGKVWLADWVGTQVAVKELMGMGGERAKDFAALMHEVTLLSSYTHPNIMRFLAVCVDPPMIVMQYYPHGSLFDLLHRASKNNPKAVRELAWSKRLDMLRDVAAGMHYLHTRKPPVIHGDLRSPNLLLDMTIDRERPRFHVKIADFGLARMLTGPGSVLASKTTNPRWSAPEVIRNSMVGKAADVYSFAIIMWEMLTWQQPYEDMMSVQVIFSTVSENSRPDVPPESQLPGQPGASLHLYRQLMERCWDADAAKRPSFKEVVEFFQGMQSVESEVARKAQGTTGTTRSRRASDPANLRLTTMAAPDMGAGEGSEVLVGAAPGGMGGDALYLPYGLAPGSGPRPASQMPSAPHTRHLSNSSASSSDAVGGGVRQANASIVAQLQASGGFAAYAGFGGGGGDAAIAAAISAAAGGGGDVGRPSSSELKSMGGGGGGGTGLPHPLHMGPLGPILEEQGSVGSPAVSGSAQAQALALLRQQQLLLLQQQQQLEQLQHAAWGLAPLPAQGQMPLPPGPGARGFAQSPFSTDPQLSYAVLPPGLYAQAQHSQPLMAPRAGYSNASGSALPQGRGVRARRSSATAATGGSGFPGAAPAWRPPSGGQARMGAGALGSGGGELGVRALGSGSKSARVRRNSATMQPSLLGPGGSSRDGALHDPAAASGSPFAQQQAQQLTTHSSSEASEQQQQQQHAPAYASTFSPFAAASAGSMAAPAMASGGSTSSSNVMHYHGGIPARAGGSKSGVHAHMGTGGASSSLAAHGHPKRVPGPSFGPPPPSPGTAGTTIKTVSSNGARPHGGGLAPRGSVGPVGKTSGSGLQLRNSDSATGGSQQQQHHHVHGGSSGGELRGPSTAPSMTSTAGRSNSGERPDSSTQTPLAVSRTNSASSSTSGAPFSQLLHQPPAHSQASAPSLGIPPGGHAVPAGQAAVSAHAGSGVHVAFAPAPPAVHVKPHAAGVPGHKRSPSGGSSGGGNSARPRSASGAPPPRGIPGSPRTAGATIAASTAAATVAAAAAAAAEKTRKAVQRRASGTGPSLSPTSSVGGASHAAAGAATGHHFVSRFAPGMPGGGAPGSPSIAGRSSGPGHAPAPAARNPQPQQQQTQHAGAAAVAAPAADEQRVSADGVLAKAGGELAGGAHHALGGTAAVGGSAAAAYMATAQSNPHAQRTAAHTAISSPFAAASALSSPFAQEAGAPPPHKGGPFAAAAHSPFAAASAAAASPFAAVAASSPFAAAQQQQPQRPSASPFAAAQSPFAAAQEQAGEEDGDDGDGGERGAGSWYDGTGVSNARTSPSGPGPGHGPATGVISSPFAAVAGAAPRGGGGDAMR